MKGANEMGLPQQLPAQHIDDTLDRQVEEYSKLYSIDQWLQPRRWVDDACVRLVIIVCTSILWLMTCCLWGPHLCTVAFGQAAWCRCSWPS
jgi:hypothetical protein